MDILILEISPHTILPLTSLSFSWGGAVGGREIERERERERDSLAPMLLSDGQR
jgi:hypothetical protein